MEFEIGDKVIKYSTNWIESEFDELGRGDEIGEIIDIIEEKIDVKWTEGKCFENEKELLLVIEDDGKINNGEYYKDVENGEIIRIEGIRLKPNFGYNNDGKEGSKMMTLYITSSRQVDKKIIEDSIMVEYIKNGQMIKVQLDGYDKKNKL